MKGDDELLLRFLSEMVHPIVRPDVSESQNIVQLVNSFLVEDGFELVEKARIPNNTIYISRRLSVFPAVNSAREMTEQVDMGYVATQITRMEVAIKIDPDFAIGTAKELIESCWKQY